MLRVDVYTGCDTPGACCRRGPDTLLDTPCDTAAGRPETYHRFRHTCQQLVLINDQICDLRPVEETAPADELKK